MKYLLLLALWYAKTFSQQEGYPPPNITTPEPCPSCRINLSTFTQDISVPRVSSDNVLETLSLGTATIETPFGPRTSALTSQVASNTSWLPAGNTDAMTQAPLGASLSASLPFVETSGYINTNFSSQETTDLEAASATGRSDDTSTTRAFDSINTGFGPSTTIENTPSSNSISNERSSHTGSSTESASGKTMDTQATTSTETITRPSGSTTLEDVTGSATIVSRESFSTSEETVVTETDATTETAIGTGTATGSAFRDSQETFATETATSENFGTGSGNSIASETTASGITDIGESSTATRALFEFGDGASNLKSVIFPGETDTRKSSNAPTRSASGITINSESINAPKVNSNESTTSPGLFETTTFVTSVVDSATTATAIDLEKQSATSVDIPRITVHASKDGSGIPEGPITTNNAEPVITSTLTVPPAGFTPITVGRHSEWTSNTWITTTSEGSSEPTVVPVLVGCKYCGGDGSGIVLFGFPPFLHTLFEFPGLPEISFPCIPTIFTKCDSDPQSSSDNSNDEDDDDKKPSSTDDASSSCTNTVTASDCLVACTTYTGPADGGKSFECTTTCTKTHTGCRVMGVTSTTSARACDATRDSCVACNRWPGMDMQDDNYDNDPDLDQDWEIDARDVFSYQEKRAKKASNMILELGKKVASEDDPKGKAFCKIKGPLKFPAYPGGGTTFKADQNNRLTGDQDKISRWYLYDYEGTCIPNIKRVDLTEYLRIAGSIEGKKTPSIDHIFEKSFLKDFFEVILDDDVESVRSDPKSERDKITCSDLEYYTFDDKTGTNRLQDVFDAYPSKDKYLNDLIGMSQDLNGEAKGKVTTTFGDLALSLQTQERVKAQVDSTDWAAFAKSINIFLVYLERIYIGIKILNERVAIEAMQRQNSRIWSAFQKLDSSVSCYAGMSENSKVWSFADKYRNYIDRRFSGDASWSINKLARDARDRVGSKVQDLLENRLAPLNENPDRRREEEAELESFKLRLRAAQSATYDVSIIWEWQHLKRETGAGQDGGTCPLWSSTIGTSTTFSTSVIRSGTSTAIDVSSATALGSHGFCLFDIQCKMRLKCDEEEQPTCFKGFCVCKKKPTAPATFTVTQHKTSTVVTARTIMNEAPSSPTVAPPAPPEITYDCNGISGISCKGLKVKYCDDAVNNLQRGDSDHIYESGPVASYRSGNRAWGSKYSRLCGVYIAGTRQDGQNCRITGDDMWKAYQKIRQSGCDICGRQHLGDGCMVVVAEVNGKTWRT